jgi:hypothetical protein
MKNFPQKTNLLCAVTVAFLILPTLGHGQNNQTYDGGTGVWDTDPANTDWDSGANPWTNGNNAFFTAATNDLTVNGTVVSNYMEFDSGVTSATISGGTIQQASTTGDPTLINDFASGDVTVNSQIVVGLTGGDGQGFVNNSSSYNLTLGNVDLDPGSRLQVQAFGSGPITLNGAFTSSDATGGQINFNSTGTYNITANANFSNFAGSNLNNYGGGVLNIANSTFTSAQTYGFVGNPAGSNVVNLVGAQTINLAVYDSMKYGANAQPDGVVNYGVAVVNQSTATASNWTGAWNQDGTNMSVGAVAGGRLAFSGNLGGNTPMGLSVTGDGVVVLSSATGNSYDERDGNGFLEPGSTTAADLKSGTTLITNTSGSAFGIASYDSSYALYIATGGQNGGNGNPTNAFINNGVKLEAGATLGGTGISLQKITAMGATSVVTAGDPGQAGLGIAPSIGQLNLTGGLTTTLANGMTFNFKLNGNLGGSAPVAKVDNDLIVLGDLTLNGPITVNITSLDGAVAVGTAYTFMEGVGGADWSEGGIIGTTLNFNVVAPTGYELDKSYGTDGYYFNTGQGADGTGSAANTFSVEFEAAPEPATYGLLGLGLLALVAIGRFRRLSV